MEDTSALCSIKNRCDCSHAIIAYRDSQSKAMENSGQVIETWSEGICTLGTVLRYICSLGEQPRCSKQQFALLDT